MDGLLHITVLILLVLQIKYNMGDCSRNLFSKFKLDLAYTLVKFAILKDKYMMSNFYMVNVLFERDLLKTL